MATTAPPSQTAPTQPAAASHPQPTSSDPLQTWDAAAHVAALTRLAHAQEQLTSLRTAIPTLTAPLSTAGIAQRTPAALVADFEARAHAVAAALAAFRQLWNQPDMQAALARARESGENDEGWEVVEPRPRWASLPDEILGGVGGLDIGEGEA